MWKFTTALEQLNHKTDVFGLAVEAFQRGNTQATILVETNITEDEQIQVAYLFREEENFPEVELKALKLASGHILDVGAGAGTHALTLQARGEQVTAMDRSERCCSVMEHRGVGQVVCDDIFTTQLKGIDTALLLMNGVGIAGTLEGLDLLLTKLYDMLNPGGQVLLESTDIIYMYEEEDGSVLLDLNGAYYGELDYAIQFNGQEETFPWLYVGAEVLQDHAEPLGFDFKVVASGPMNSYLARLKKPLQP